VKWCCSYERGREKKRGGGFGDAWTIGDCWSNSQIILKVGWMDPSYHHIDAEMIGEL
jgi:hypothetical protein